MSPTRGEPGEVGEAGGGHGGHGGKGGEGSIGPAGRPGADGARGAEGRAGSEGRAGATGDTGSRGIAGYPGPAGITGQDGISGLPGVAGPEGHRGSTGLTGSRGSDAPPVLSRIQTIVLFLFVVAAFAVLAYRAELNIRETARVTHVACERSNQNSETINSFLDLLIRFSKQSTVLTPAEKAERVTRYQATKVEPIDCR